MSYDYFYKMRYLKIAIRTVHYAWKFLKLGVKPPFTDRKHFEVSLLEKNYEQTENDTTLIILFWKRNKPKVIIKFYVAFFKSYFTHCDD